MTQSQFTFDPRLRNEKGQIQLTPLHPDPLLASIGCSETILSRFYSKIEITDCCWFWTGKLHHTGYAHIRLGGGRVIGAHVLSWIVHFCEIPKLFVCHSCDHLYPVGDTANRACVNPAHLFLGTNADNMSDAALKGRMRWGERSPRAKLTRVQVQLIRELSSNGESAKNLADQFGVSAKQIRVIVKKTQWTHL